MSTKTTPFRRACTACTKAKRSCSKQSPRCSRCRHRDINCSYPPYRPTAWDYAVSGSEADAGGSERVAFTSPSPGVGDEEGQDATTTPTAITGPKSLALSLHDDWFYSPDSWAITHGCMQPLTTEQLEADAMKGFITVVQQWLQQWVRTGSCPFIHHRLYSRTLPVPVQDAFTALSTYLSRTTDTTNMCLRIIRTRITNLVDEATNGPSSESRSGSAFSSMPLLDPFNHLARVQALLVYQVVGLWDGDVGLRNFSEQHISVLYKWAREMLDCVELESSVYFVVQRDQQIAHVSSHEDLEQMTWQRWILCESIRRTWMMVSATQGIYLALKQSWSHCEGGIKVTTQASTWDADNAFTWGQALARSSRPLLSHTLEAFTLLDKTRPEDVDDFARVVIEMMCSKEKIARWKSSSASYIPTYVG